MKTQELEKLKKILKPMIRECIKEAIFEEGVLSTLVAEIASGMGQNTIVESAPQPTREKSEETRSKETAKVNERLRQTKDKMLEAIGKDAYGGVDLFEGTNPMTSGRNATPAHSPMSGVDPNDSGVSIDGLMGAFGSKWKALK